MTLKQANTKATKGWLVLVLIVALFSLKGAFLSLLMPWFQNPDEQIHYATVQHWTEPEEKTWDIVQKPAGFLHDPNDVRTYNFPEETGQSAYYTGFDAVKFESQNIQDFSDPNTESIILSNTWKHYVDTAPSAVSGTKSVYYALAAGLERLFGDESIFVRMFVARLLAVVFGVLTVLLAYLTVRKIGFSERASLLFTTLVAFQPMFSITAAQINIDSALIFAFSLFLYAGVSLLRGGPDWKYALLAILATILGFYSKGPGIVLIGALLPLSMYVAYEHFHPNRRRFFWSVFAISSLAIALFFLFTPSTYLASITNLHAESRFDSSLASIGKYLDKTLTTGELRDTVRSYWGHFGWLDSSIPDWTLSLILLISLIGFGGTLWYIFSKREQPDYLPERKYLVFFLGLIVFLQVSIRFYDWRVFDYTGQILIGQPGRYFLPNLIGHLALIVTGLGFLARERARFIRLLLILTGAMILLQIESIVNVIIPRYYL